MKFMKLFSLKIWLFRQMSLWRLNVEICWRAYCAKSLKKDSAPFMVSRKFWPILGLEKIITKSSSTSKFSRLQISHQLLKSTLTITQTKKKTKNKSNKSKNNRKSSERNSSKSWRAFTTITEKATTTQDPIQRSKHPTKIKLAAPPCSDAEAHQKSEPHKILAETVKKKTAHPNKHTCIWIMKRQSWTFITIRKARWKS